MVKFWKFNAMSKYILSRHKHGSVFKKAFLSSYQWPGRSLSVPTDTYLKAEPPASLREGIFFLCRDDDDNSNISLYYEHLLSVRQYKKFYIG